MNDTALDPYDEDIAAIAMSVTTTMHRAAVMLDTTLQRKAICSTFVINAPQDQPIGRMMVDLAAGLGPKVAIAMLRHHAEVGGPSDLLMQGLADLGGTSMSIAIEGTRLAKDKQTAGFVLVTELIDEDSLRGTWIGLPLVMDDETFRLLLLTIADRLENLVEEEEREGHVH